LFGASYHFYQTCDGDVDFVFRKMFIISRLFRLLNEAFGGRVECMSAFSGAWLFAKANIGENWQPTLSWGLGE
jgi:hypothetical protein